VNASDPADERGRFLQTFGADSALVEDDPRRLCAACTSALPATRVGLSVYVAGVGLEVLCASDEVAEHIEWTQATLGEGPGIDAITSGNPLVVANLSAAQEYWPTFAVEAGGAGVNAMCALPLHVGAIQVGVLDLYRDMSAELASADFADAVAVADMVTAILLASGGGEGLIESLSSLWDQSLGAREVHQATGMIVVQLGVSVRQAYVCLRAYANSNGRSLAEVAHDVVHRRLRFAVEPRTE
jgi:hypothetical protein